MITIVRIASKKDIELGLAPSKQDLMFRLSAPFAESTVIQLQIALKKLHI